MDAPTSTIAIPYRNRPLDAQFSSRSYSLRTVSPEGLTASKNLPIFLSSQSDSSDREDCQKTHLACHHFDCTCEASPHRSFGTSVDASMTPDFRSSQTGRREFRWGTSPEQITQQTCRASTHQQAFFRETDLNGFEFRTYVEAIFRPRWLHFLDCVVFCSALQNIVCRIPRRLTNLRYPVWITGDQFGGCWNE